MGSISYWQQTAGLPGQPGPTPSDKIPHEIDVCIIGGGIVGSSAAYHLAQRGIKAIVVDQRAPGMGASGRNAGMIVSSVAGPYFTDLIQFGGDRGRALKHLAVENRERLIDLAVRLGVPIWRCGFMYLADNDEEIEILEKSAAALRTDGFSAKFLDRDPLNRGFLGALKTPDEAVTQPALLTMAIGRASGQLFITNTSVTGINPGPNDRITVHTARGNMICRRLVLATNAYTRQLLPDFAARIIPCRGQIQVSEPVPMVTTYGLGSQFGYYYFRQIPEPHRPGIGRWLMGGARHVNFMAENDHYSEDTTPEIQAALTDYTQKYFPELTEARIDYRWAGTMGFTENHLPLVEPLPGLHNAVICAGFSGHGMGLGHIAALKGIELLLDEKSAWPFVEKGHPK